MSNNDTLMFFFLQRYSTAHAAYLVKLSNEDIIHMTPYEVEDAVVKPDTKLKIAVSALFSAYGGDILLVYEDGQTIKVTEALTISQSAFLICTLDSQGSEKVHNGSILVRVPQVSSMHNNNNDQADFFRQSTCLFGASQFKRVERAYMEMQSEIMEVDIKHVQGVVVSSLLPPPQNHTAEGEASDNRDAECEGDDDCCGFVGITV